MKARLILASIIIPLGIIIAAVPGNTTLPYKLTAEQMLEEVQSGIQFIHPDEMAHMIISKDPSLQIIDVRSADEFDRFSLPNAINIPLSDILNEDYAEYIDQDVKLNVFYSNGTTDSNQAWMITRQLGYENNYVLQGGLNYWAETIINPVAPAESSPNDELAKYNFRKGAGAALGGASLEASTTTKVKTSAPPVKKRKKKKTVQGGC